MNNVVSEDEHVTIDKIESPSMPKISMWHSRLGCAHPKAIHKVLNLCKVSVNNKESFLFCHSCCLGKAHKLYAPLSNTKHTTLFDLVHTYLWEGFHPLLQTMATPIILHLLMPFIRTLGYTF